MSHPPALPCRCLVLSTVGTLLVLAGAACGSGGDQDRPDGDDGNSSDRPEMTVVIDAEVYTIDPAGEWAEAFAFDRNGTIVAVGSEDQVLAAAGDDAEVIDAEGLMVMPGFQDAHVHVPEAGINAGLCFLDPGLELPDYEVLAAECAEQQQEAPWVRAAGPSLFDLRDTDELPIEVLDRAVPDRPALILDDLGHAVWTNSAGLAAAGITETSADPQGGVFHRDGEGRLTGLLLEDAQQLVRNAAAADDEAVYRGLLVALDELARNGVTSISDAGGYWAQNHPAAWQRAADEGALTVRASNSLYVYPALDVDDQLAEFRRRFSNDDDMLRFDTAKIYVDGILDLGTASLLEPYRVPVDPAYRSGFNYFESETLHHYVDELHAIGYRISFHAIGDAAVREALDSVEAIDDDRPNITARRHRTTHTYLVDPADVERFAELGVVADFQQSADAIDPGYHLFLSEFIGDRAFDLIPTATLLEADAPIALSSDWDAGPLPPLGTVERSLTRETNPVPDLETALALSTIDAAYALGHDAMSGSITVGKQADFVILDQNLFEVDRDEIDETSVVATYLDGRPVYSVIDGGRNGG